MSDGTDWLNRRYLEMARDQTMGDRLKQVRVVFIGDSITQFFAGTDDAIQAAAWKATFGNSDSPNYALNLGLAGDRTENVLLRLLDEGRGGFGQLDNPNIQPEIIVLMIGVNNTWSAEADIVGTTVAGQIAVIRRLQTLRPNATIVVNSVLPTTNLAHSQEIIEPINRLLRIAVSKLPRVIWLDIYTAFLKPDGTGNPVLFKDGVHPNYDGYTVWSNKLLPVLDEVRAARP